MTGRRQLTALPGVFPQTPLSKVFPNCYQSTMFPPVYLASRQTLRNQLWDENLPTAHHTDFMLSVSQQHYATLVCKDLLVSSRTIHCYCLWK